MRRGPQLQNNFNCTLTLDRIHGINPTEKLLLQHWCVGKHESKKLVPIPLTSPLSSHSTPAHPSYSLITSTYNSLRDTQSNFPPEFHPTIQLNPNQPPPRKSLPKNRSKISPQNPRKIHKNYPHPHPPTIHPPTQPTILTLSTSHIHHTYGI